MPVLPVIIILKTAFRILKPRTIKRKVFIGLEDDME